jgi:hypothetical protein
VGDHLEILGWQIHHKEQLSYRANSGSPIIRLKFYHYPHYRQTIQIKKHPLQCKLKTKGTNSYFLYNQKVHTKGTILLDRIINVFPIASDVSFKNEWGKISSYSEPLQDKYQEASKYWPVKSLAIQKTVNHKWFEIDDLFRWIQMCNHYIRSKIKYRENQDERLGAYQAYLSGIGDCDEFTDLLITLTRLRGIPSRRITGYFITNQGNFFEPHAWGEIFSSELGWIPVDIAMNAIGNHTINYVILKVEEFNPALSDFQIQTKHRSKVHHQLSRPEPKITPIH